MSVIGNIPLTSLTTLVVVGALALVALLGGAALLARSEPSRCPGRARRWLGRTAILLVPTILLASAGGLVFNRSLVLVKTSGDLGNLIMSTIVGSATQTGGEADVEAQSASASELDATFTTADDGMLETTWTGPSSGITQPVDVITPTGYSTNDGKTYGVIELLHGYPGGPDGILQGLGIQQELDKAIAAGIIPPAIVVAPGLNVDEEAHDCADIEGRPAVYTWVSHDVPEMIRHNFPNTTSNRDGWMIGGFSAGAYCAIWTALRTPQTYGDQYLADNTLSTMLANRTPDGLRIYAMAAGDDAVGGAYTALKMASAVKDPDSVTTDVPPTGGHTGPLWSEHIPNMLAWWGSSDRVARAVGSTPTAATAQSSEAYESVVPVTTVTHEVQPTAPNGYVTLGILIVGVLISLVLAWHFAPRWQLGRHDEGTDEEHGEHHARHRAQRSGRFNALPRPVLSALGYLARLTALGAAVGSAAALIGIASNMVGGFYTSWSSIAESFVAGLR